MDISGLTKLKNLIINLYYLPRVNNEFFSSSGDYESFSSSEDWACMVKLKELESIQITGFGINDKGLEYLSGLKKLLFINIFCEGETSITDNGIKHLASLPKLGRLVIKDGHFTDKALEYLSGMPDLRDLELTSDFAFSNKAITNFQTKNPNIENLKLIP
jgi:hypothetical protein